MEPVSSRSIGFFGHQVSARGVRGREVHPFEPYLNGQKVTEAAWRALVKAMHAIDQ